MSEKPGRIAITWNAQQTAILRELAEKYGDTMRLNDITPYTTSSGDRKPNASGILYFLMLKETGRLRRSE